MNIDKVKGPHLVKLARGTVGHSTADGSRHLPAIGDATVGSSPVLLAGGVIGWRVIDPAAIVPAPMESFPRGDIVWQTDPGGLWDSGLCFVHLFPTPGGTELVYLDFQFASGGTPGDGKWAVFGGVEAAGSWSVLAQGNLPNTSKGITRYALPTALDISAYDSIALAQDPGAAGLAQPVRQASVYYSPAPPSGLPAAYAYLGAHTHGAVFSALPAIPAADPIYLMQKWSSIGVR